MGNQALLARPCQWYGDDMRPVIMTTEDAYETSIIAGELVTVTAQQIPPRRDTQRAWMDGRDSKGRYLAGPTAPQPSLGQRGTAVEVVLFVQRLTDFNVHIGQPGDSLTVRGGVTFALLASAKQTGSQPQRAGIAPIEQALLGPASKTSTAE